MTPADLIQCPRPVRWRHITAGQVLHSHDGELWLIWSVTPALGGRLHVHLLTPARRWDGPVDPDETVQVLVPMTERDALALLGAQLGAEQCGPMRVAA